MKLSIDLVRLLILSCILLPVSGGAQQVGDNVRGIFGISFDYKAGFGRVKFDSVKVDNDHNAQDIQFSYLRPLNESIHLGIGLGLTGYHQPARNTFPIEIKCRYSPSENKKEIGLELNIGYAMPFGQTFKEGFTSSLGVGWYPNLGKNRHLGLELGYTLQQIKDVKLIHIVAFPSHVEITTIIDNTTAHFVYVGISYRIW